MASFFYSLFGESQPITLQLLAFMGMGVSSGWDGRPGLAGVFAQHCRVSAVPTDSDEVGAVDDGDDSSTKATSKSLLLIAILSKFVTAFFGEWAFLPELVLATTSVKISSTHPSTNCNNSSGDCNDRAVTGDNELELSPISTGNITSHYREDLEGNSSLKDNDKRIAMEYGTLISCIDFGDQLGSLTAAPLVAILNISRENDFLHLDRLILICALANMVVTIGLLPLLVEKRTK
eukprot:CAMPEP_0168243896 /NCGR_PEP_ID=MMETSP0140_2-20121125/24313_1 /TAXON_ID=44445 /ORGANISM="Pseudo-nitzschia australis, Strain 10249 10 AB" /LENGTH=233 /DNA_ID=CAMNT_0008179325 /DNA_START=349 /DNA_END=1051 /DNA_ORIENTATION=-